MRLVIKCTSIQKLTVYKLSDNLLWIPKAAGSEKSYAISSLKAIVLNKYRFSLYIYMNATIILYSTVIKQCTDWSLSHFLGMGDLEKKWQKTLIWKGNSILNCHHKPRTVSRHMKHFAEAKRSGQCLDGVPWGKILHSPAQLTSDRWHQWTAQPSTLPISKSLEADWCLGFFQGVVHSGGLPIGVDTWLVPHLVNLWYCSCLDRRHSGCPMDTLEFCDGRKVGYKCDFFLKIFYCCWAEKLVSLHTIRS